MNAGSPCPRCGGKLHYEVGRSDVLRCASCGVLLTTGVERRKVDAGKIILTILGVLIVAAGIVFVGCAIVLGNVH